MASSTALCTADHQLWRVGLGVRLFTCSLFLCLLHQNVLTVQWETPLHLPPPPTSVRCFTMPPFSSGRDSTCHNLENCVLDVPCAFKCSLVKTKPNTQTHIHTHTRTPRWDKYQKETNLFLILLVALTGQMDKGDDCRIQLNKNLHCAWLHFFWSHFVNCVPKIFR